MNEQGRFQPGWYPDPSGHPGQQRWWDGTRWTEHIQSAPATAPPPSPGGGTSNALKIVLIALGVLTLLTVGGCVACAALVGETANDVSRELERELEREFKRNSITKEQYDSVELGTRRESVERRLGPPADEYESAGSTCISYNRRGGELGDTFQFCFANGRLDRKNAY
jgi:hypothetical protein